MSRRRKVPYAGFIVAAPITAVLVYAATRPFLPDELATVNALPFLYNDPESPEEALFSLGSQSFIASAVALVGLWRTRADARMPLYGRWGVLFAWLASGYASAGMVQNIGADDYAASQGRWWVWWLLFPAMIPVIAMHRKLMPRSRLEQSRLPPPPSSLALGPGERIVWTGSSTARRRVLGGVLVSAAVITAAVLWSPTVLVGLVVSVSLVAGTRQWTLIDRRGVTVHGRLRMPHYVIPLDEISTASASEDRSYLKDLNGDAYDRTLVGPYLVNRRGPALTVEFGDGQIATISVDDAQEAADVLNGLLARLRIDARAGEAER
jgi:hypothetical protein